MGSFGKRRANAGKEAGWKERRAGGLGGVRAGVWRAEATLIMSVLVWHVTLDGVHCLSGAESDLLTLASDLSSFSSVCGCCCWLFFHTCGVCPSHALSTEPRPLLPEAGSQLPRTAERGPCTRPARPVSILGVKTYLSGTVHNGKVGDS